ncbi:MAG: exostosin domain-containing protein, partial [Planctomycetota bacterium]
GWERKLSLYRKFFEHVACLRQVTAPAISVIVISWRLHPDTIKSFESLIQQRNENFELVFVDNGAKPGEFDCLKPFIDTYVRLNQNTGAYLARNVGAVFAKGRIILFLDDDGIPETDILRSYREAFDKYEAVAVRGSIWPKDRNAEPYDGNQNYGDKPFPYFSCQEGITAYDALVFYYVGGWDDKIIFGGGGIDISRRLLDVEPDMRKQIYLPQIVLYHDRLTDEAKLRNKKKKQSISEERLRRKHSDYRIFQRYYKVRYYQRPDMLILKNVQSFSGVAQQNSAEHLYSIEKARSELKKLGISENPNEVLELNEQAKVLAGQGNTVAALTLLKKAVEIDPSFVVGYNNMGLLYCHTGALQNALREFISSLNIDPLNAETVIYTAKILDEMGESDRARTLLTNYLKHDPKNDQVLNLLSSMGDVQDGTVAAQSDSSASYVDKINTVNFVRGIDGGQGKIFVIPVKPEFMPATMAWPYPVHNDYYGVEQDFLAYLYANNELVTHDWRKAKWHYLPVYWQHWMFLNDYGKKNLHLLDAELKRCIVDDTKTFTVCLYSNLSQVHVGRSTLMLPSRNIDRGIDIPLLCTYHKLPQKLPPKRYLANFVGRLSTGDIRGQMIENLKGRNDVFLAESETGTERFAQAMLESYIALSPRGYGGDSFRFYEAMQLGTTPFFIGDLDTRPFKSFIDWDQISLYAPDASNVSDIIDSVSKERLIKMGKNAGRVFAEKLCYQKWCAYALKELELIDSGLRQRQEILI